MTGNVRRMLTRLVPITLVSAALVAAAAVAPSALAAVSPDDPAVATAVNAAATDYSTLVADAEEKRATPAQLGPSSYTEGLFLYGTYLVYQRTHNTKYLTYMKSWADRFVDSKGHLNNGLSSLDSMQSGNVLLELYKETKDSRYKTAATQIRNRLKTWPLTKDGGFWH